MRRSLCRLPQARSLRLSNALTGIRPLVCRQPRWLHTSRVSCSSHDIVQHRDTPENNPHTPFEWTQESLTRIETVLKKFPTNYKQSAVISLLYIAQEQNRNWIPLVAMNKVAEILDMAPIRVYEVATFYTMFNRKPVGRYHLQVCGTTPCMLCGAEAIRDTVSRHLGIRVGDTTKDGLFTLAEVECLGACVNAPMMQINNEHFFEFLTPENTIQLIESLRTGGLKSVKVNNQNHVFSCEGPQGQTTLLTIPPAPCRDLDMVRADMVKKREEEEAKKKAAAAAAAAATAAATSAAGGTASAAKP